MTELWRRVVLAGAVATGVWLWLLADLAPLVRLEAGDFARRQWRHGGAAGALVEGSRRSGGTACWSTSAGAITDR